MDGNSPINEKLPTPGTLTCSVLTETALSRARTTLRRQESAHVSLLLGLHLNAFRNYDVLVAT